MFKLTPKSYSITDTFGVDAGKAQVMGFEHGHPCVPRLDEHFIFDLDFIRTMVYVLRTQGVGMWALGPTGAGKSQGFAQIAARLGIPLIAPPIGDNTEFTDLLGGMYPSPQGGFVWRDGPFTTACRNGYLFVAEELNTKAPEFQMAFVPILDHGVLHIPVTDERIQVHPNFRMLVTGNAGVSGDQTGLYRGVQTGNLAFGDRFIFAKVSYLTPEQESGVLTRANPGLPEELRGYMIQTANEVRKLFLGEDGFGGGSLSTVISTRKLRQWANLTAAYAKVDANMKKAYFPKKALEVTLTCSIPAAEAQTINDLGQAAFGPDWQ
ncbi:MAG: AAA domain-containing protein [Desulfovibrio sp.]|uniref:AAA family ATPase n=1 Tax=Desulfovibrio sp. TaxID=885 RepID=UPI00135EB5F3|nr:AAA family ATPase [Desulfovibrio sp.]MTJ93960.1 AAA domain-containing protein [Desulfovibrio sp.]